LYAWLIFLLENAFLVHWFLEWHSRRSSLSIPWELVRYKNSLPPHQTESIRSLVVGAVISVLTDPAGQSNARQLKPREPTILGTFLQKTGVAKWGASFLQITSLRNSPLTNIILVIIRMLRGNLTTWKVLC
jgi:hypothetical protein